MCLLTPEQVSWSIWAVAGGCDQGMGGGCDQGVGGGCDQRMLKIGLGQSKKNYPYEFNGKELIVVNSVAYI